ncbi:energy transducer TonB [Zwartia vadi]|uniref:energy transducer TonB n=1 Tax=Zwartia vadi TaxID=3058168 RepID=UPI0025B47C37|nr:energy transducer TonB [Zwartia vadi]MDN3988330.1 energy transducer TonB [Zwartia vadi]
MRLTSPPSDSNPTPTRTNTAGSDLASTGGKPVAFQRSSGLSLGTILSLVIFAHLLVIVLLLTHFGWPGGSDEMDTSMSGQSGLVIPVTLETADKQDTSKQDSEQPASEKPDMTPPVEKPEDDQSVDDQSAEKPVEERSVDKKSVDETSADEKPVEEQPTQPPPPIAPREPATPSSRLPLPTVTSSIQARSSGDASSQHQDTGSRAELSVTPAKVDPNYLHRPDPIYPPLSKRMREQGKVLLRVSLDAQGAVKDIKIQQSSDFQRLDQAALEAVRQWRFLPARRGQEPVAATVDVPIEFRHP